MVQDSASSPLDQLITRLEIHQELSEDARQAILALPCKQRMVEAQTYLVREGDLPDRCAVLMSGYAFRHKVTGDGSRQILSLHIPGEALDFQHLFVGEADHNVQMLTRGEVAEIPRQSIEDLALANAEVGRAIMISTLAESSVFREWTLNIGRRDARSRIAHLLCEFAVRLTAQGLRPDGGFELPMTQEQLADATGLTPVHVSRVLKGLETDGLISRNRRTINFPQWELLRDVGDFSSRYLHIRESRLGGPHNLKHLSTA